MQFTAAKLLNLAFVQPRKISGELEKENNENNITPCVDFKKQ